MKLWSSEYTFNHPWTTVTEACWRKYPNELNPNVRAIDVIDRKVTDNGCLLTTRIFGTNWNLPSIITSLFGMPEMCYAVEHIEVDPNNKKMTLKMINYTFWGFMAVKENIVYEPCASDSEKTVMRQGAEISVTGVQFKDYLEGLIAKGFEGNSSKGRVALEGVIAKINLEGALRTLSDEVQDLSRSLDKAKVFIDSEVQELSRKLNSELTSLVSKVDDELSQITVNISPMVEASRSPAATDLASANLTEAVKLAGITSKAFE